MMPLTLSQRMALACTHMYSQGVPDRAMMLACGANLAVPPVMSRLQAAGTSALFAVLSCFWCTACSLMHAMPPDAGG